MGPTRAGEGGLTRGATSFFARTGHAFVAEEHGTPRGVALAQAVWDGTRPTVRIGTLTAVARDADDADPERPSQVDVRAALLEAVTKSAYDAAVYDLAIEAPEDDQELHALLQREGWATDPVRLHRRTLGSRGATP